MRLQFITLEERLVLDAAALAVLSEGIDGTPDNAEPSENVQGLDEILAESADSPVSSEIETNVYSVFAHTRSQSILDWDKGLEGLGSDWHVSAVDRGDLFADLPTLNEDGDLTYRFLSGASGDIFVELRSSEGYSRGVTMSLVDAQGASIEAIDETASEDLDPLIVSSDDISNHEVFPEDDFEGVVKLILQTFSGGTFLCSGTLLSDGLHILTAAHCVTDSNGDVDISTVSIHFETDSGNQIVTGNTFFVHPSWEGNLRDGGDLAIIRMDSVAPAGVYGYDINRDSNEIGEVAHKVGYGRTGTGDTGAGSSIGVKHEGDNRYDSDSGIINLISENTWADNQLVFDFDNGTAENDAFGFYFGVNADQVQDSFYDDLGLGDLEVGTAPGDSGSPSFINAEIAGVASYGLTFTDESSPDFVSGLNSSWGEFGGDSRVSVFATWIDSIVTPHNTASLDGQIYEDLNADGIQNIGDVGLAGVTVELFRSNGLFVGSAVSDINGNYSFDGLVEAEYYVHVSETSSLKISPFNINNNLDPSSGNSSNILVLDASTTTAPLGAVYQLGSIGNRVWEDLNNNGLQDSGENGIEGITLHLLDADSSAILETTTSDTNGLYSFSAEPGEYRVEIVLPLEYNLSPIDQGADDSIDNDFSEFDFRTDTITLSSGEIQDTWDAGLAPTTLIEGFAFQDANANGGLDLGESVFSNLNVRLLGANQLLIAETLTDASGSYHFSVAPGDYIVEVIAPEHVSHSPLGPDNDINPNTERSDLIEILAHGETVQVDIGLVVQAVIGDHAWYDLNGNGLREITEPFIEGVTVILRDPDTMSILVNSVTGFDGSYQFFVDPGSYIVQFQAPAGLILSDPFQGIDRDRDSNPDPSSGLSEVITVLGGEVRNDIDAGVKNRGAANPTRNFILTFSEGYEPHEVRSFRLHDWASHNNNESYPLDLTEDDYDLLLRRQLLRDNLD
ncbi:MAG: hypothetical protein CMO81_00650 [Waddliaceae bacterium]|nr:hypothetical protein [Waddliaceae bacterium]